MYFDVKPEISIALALLTNCQNLIGPNPQQIDKTNSLISLVLVNFLSPVGFAEVKLMQAVMSLACDL